MVDLEKAAVHCDSPVSESGLGIRWGQKWREMLAVILDIRSIDYIFLLC